MTAGPPTQDDWARTGSAPEVSVCLSVGDQRDTADIFNCGYALQEKDAYVRGARADCPARAHEPRSRVALTERNSTTRQRRTLRQGFAGMPRQESYSSSGSSRSGGWS